MAPLDNKCHNVRDFEFEAARRGDAAKAKMAVALATLASVQGHKTF